MKTQLDTTQYTAHKHPGKFEGMETKIKEGNEIIHEDKFGQSAGIAWSDQIGDRIKINFSSGRRAGECRWIPLSEVSLHVSFSLADALKSMYREESL